MQRKMGLQILEFEGGPFSNTAGHSYLYYIWVYSTKMAKLNTSLTFFPFYQNHNIHMIG